jgi:hypothetical protein
VYALAGSIVIGLGLGSRWETMALPPFVAKYAGDALWALLVFLGFGFLFTAQATWRVALLALAFSFAVEFSQLYHAPWIDHLRSYRLGSLVLGDTFGWGDLAAYTVGVASGAAAEWAAAEIAAYRRTRAYTDGAGDYDRGSTGLS